MTTERTLAELQEVGWAEFIVSHQYPLYDLIQDNDPESFDIVDISQEHHHSFHINVDCLDSLFPSDCGVIVITDKTMIDCSDKTTKNIAHVINALKKFIILCVKEAEEFAIRISLAKNEFAALMWTLSVQTDPAYTIESVPVILKTRSYRTITNDDMKQADLFILSQGWINKGDPEWIKHHEICITCHPK